MKPRALLACLFTAGLLTVPPAAQCWEPATGTTPLQVLRAAAEDTATGRQAQAQEKFAWLDSQSTAEAGGSGVGLTVLLTYWARLARDYPPAMESLHQKRERLIEQIERGGFQGDKALNSLIMLNAQIEAPASTRDAYLRFAARDPVLAEGSVLRALPAFVALQDYALVAPYLHVPSLLSQATLMGQVLKRSQPSEQRGTQRLAERGSDLMLARAVLVLVKTGRAAEAEQVVRHYREAAGADVTTHHMTQALSGVAPPDNN